MKLKRITAVLMSAVLITGLAGCAGNSGSGKSENGESVPDEPVKIATKPMTEQFILGEMLKLLIEEKAGYEVEYNSAIKYSVVASHGMSINLLYISV